MKTQNITKEILAYNKSVIKLSFDALSAFSDQTSVATDFLLGATPSVPEEGKKAISIYFKESQKGLANLKKNVESGLEIDLTDKDASVKNLEVMENICKDAFSQAAEFKKETKALVEKATKQLPKEAKPLIDFWNDSVNSGLEFFQNYVNKNFELARKVMTDVSAATPAAETKAAK